MHITEILCEHHPTVSFEFFPPETDEAAERMYHAVEQLKPLRPSFVTVTYGAGGSTRERTRNLVVRLNAEIGITTIPHLTCVGADRDEIGEILQTYVDHGIENVLALRGDPPEGCDRFEPTANGFRYANELVEFIKHEFPSLGIGVAGYPEGHPETPNKVLDIENLKRKIDAGADVVFSQLFFDNRDYYDFVSRCKLEGISVPILAGIMPILSLGGVNHMAGVCGARIPASLLRSLKRSDGDTQAIRRIGTHWATEQCFDLFDHDVRGIHLYTLNRSSATWKIYQSLGIQHSDVLRR